MNLPWKLKSFVFGSIEAIKAVNFLYFLQKGITGCSRRGISKVSKNWQLHKEYLVKYNSIGTVFEFGAGKSLAQNLYISDIVKKQIVVDLNPMIDLDLTNKARKYLAKLVDLKSIQAIKTLKDLESYGIEYRAPYNAAKTDFKNRSIDACISTNTLEHIPKISLESIFAELFRILNDDGIISAKIDYSDHYAHTDKSISLLNFLKFDERTWKKYNHNCHYQNRLRHYDYLAIFRKSGFVIIEEELTYGENNIPPEVIKAFQDKDKTWKATSGHIILKKEKY